MRICAISLYDLRVELVGESAKTSEPFAVVVAEPPLTETTLLGTTRLSVVSRQAQALGVCPGQTLAQARARVSGLSVHVVRPWDVDRELERIAEVALAFGATCSLGRAGDSPYGDMVWIDITGCAHLHAPKNVHGATSNESSELLDSDGREATLEAIMAAKIERVIRELGHACAVAIADGPRVAAMFAHALGQSRAKRLAKSTRKGRGLPHPSDLDPTFVVPRGDNMVAMNQLGVASLPLSSEDMRWLAKLGVRSIAQMRQLPRGELASRLKGNAREIFSLLDGDDRAPLTPYVPPEIPEESLLFEVGVEGASALTFVAKTLCDRLSVRLMGRGMAAASIELELQLDRAMLEDPSEDKTLVLLDLPAALSAGADLLAALRPKIERLSLPAPVLSAVVRAKTLVRQQATTLSLFESEPQAKRRLPRLVAELVSDLGNEAVCSLVLGDDWCPSRRSVLVPYGVGSDSWRSSKKQRRLLSCVPEPTRLAPTPISVRREEVQFTRHLLRVRGESWWKASPSVSSPGPSERRTVDYAQGWTHDGLALLSIERASGAVSIVGWFD